jgi:two-component system cell cycle response regulator DivK
MSERSMSAVKENSREPMDPHDAYVLVVEDNLQNLVLIARLLAFLGVQRYEWKASGWQVLEFADTMPRVDLVLMDIHLPYQRNQGSGRNRRRQPYLNGESASGRI